MECFFLVFSYFFLFSWSPQSGKKISEPWMLLYRTDVPKQRKKDPKKHNFPTRRNTLKFLKYSAPPPKQRKAQYRPRQGRGDGPCAQTTHHNSSFAARMPPQGLWHKECWRQTGNCMPMLQKDVHSAKREKPAAPHRQDSSTPWADGTDTWASTHTGQGQEINRPRHNPAARRRGWDKMVSYVWWRPSK